VLDEQPQQKRTVKQLTQKLLEAERLRLDLETSLARAYDSQRSLTVELEAVRKAFEQVSSIAASLRKDLDALKRRAFWRSLRDAGIGGLLVWLLTVLL
jgi:hypothetical protein